MNCDFLVLLFLGLSDKESVRDGVGENVSEVLNQVANYCKATSDYDGLSPRNHQQKFIHTTHKNYGNKFNIYGRQRPLTPKSSRRNSVYVSQYNDMPYVDGNAALNRIINNNEMSNVMVKIPASAIYKLLPRDEISSLYQKNLVVDVPISDPSSPRLVAMTGGILGSLIKGKNRLHNVVDFGVAGAENIFSGINEAAGGIAEFIGDGAHNILDFIG